MTMTTEVRTDLADPTERPLPPPRKTLRERLHDLLVRLRARWIVVVGLIAPFAAFAPEIWEGVQSIDYTGLSLKGAAVAVGLIVLRVVAVRGLAMLIAAPAADDKAP